MSSEQERRELDERARRGETVVPGAAPVARALKPKNTSLKEGEEEGHTRKEQLGSEGYHEMGRKGGLSTMDESGGERAANEGIQIDKSNFRTRS